MLKKLLEKGNHVTYASIKCSTNTLICANKMKSRLTTSYSCYRSYLNCLRNFSWNASRNWRKPTYSNSSVWIQEQVFDYGLSSLDNRRNYKVSRGKRSMCNDIPARCKADELNLCFLHLWPLVQSWIRWG